MRDLRPHAALVAARARRYRGGVTFSEIGEALGVSTQAACQMCQAGLQIIRERLRAA